MNKRMQTAEKRKTKVPESPDYLRLSLAAAMTLGVKPGWFYRGARLHCINLLLTYAGGCAARCAYCGLSGLRPGEYRDKSFIRVDWPACELDDIIARIAARLDRVKRICISQITNTRCIEDTQTICARLRKSFDVPVSLLISPTIVTRENLLDFKAAGADKIGVAIDLATPALFNRYRGKGIGGPHRYERYLECLEEAISIFGRRNAGSHFVTGMGETEKEMVEAIQCVQDMGGWTHLFSFFPETDSRMSDHPLPDMDHYRRIQLARYIIDQKIADAARFTYDENDRIAGFGLTGDRLDAIINTGEPFRTSGCAGYDGEVACNRPFANSRPGPNIRNFPFPPDWRDIARIRMQLGLPHAPMETPAEEDGEE